MFHRHDRRAPVSALAEDELRQRGARPGRSTGAYFLMYYVKYGHGIKNEHTH